MLKNKKPAPEYTRYGAVDIGSNAVRAWVATKRSAKIKKIQKKRYALRLGREVLETGSISTATAQKLFVILKETAEMFRTFDVAAYRACATESLRMAENGREIIRDAEIATGLKINILDGTEEALLIYHDKVARIADSGKNTLFMDVGGGSSDVVIRKLGEEPAARSFKIGTLRLLTNQVPEGEWESLEKFLKNHITQSAEWEFFGSGGNIRTLRKLSEKKKNEALTLSEILHYHKKMQPLTDAERMKTWNLKHDRADVIVPAMDIFLFAMEKSGLHSVYVPKTNLCRGLIASL